MFAQAQPGTTKRSRNFWFLAFLAVMAVHALWLYKHTAPPVWDMAHHQWMALRFMEAIREGSPLGSLIRLSDYYPPLYYLQEGFFVWLLGRNGFLPLLANTPGLFLLSYSTYRIASTSMRFPNAEIAGILVLLFPMVAWTSRESLLDISLAGWVAASVLLIVRSQWLSDTRIAAALGITLALGMCTKWTFAVFLAGPMMFALAGAENRRRSLRNLLLAHLVALPLILLWYLPNLNSLADRFRTTAQAATLEGDPTLWEWKGWFYYVRAASSYYLFLPLSLALVWGIVRKRWIESPKDSFFFRMVVVWTLVSLLVLTSLNAKDPRYMIPVAAPLAILLILVWHDSMRAVTAILAIAVVQFLCVSFALTGGKIRLALFHEDANEDFRSVNTEWVLFQTDYFDELGAPRREDWQLSRLLSSILDNRVVGFVPELPRFHAAGLQLEAAWQGRKIHVYRIGDSTRSLEDLQFLSHAITATGTQGIRHLTLFNERAASRIRELGWELVQEVDLPNGEKAQLWNNPEWVPTLKPTDPAYEALRVGLVSLVHMVIPPKVRVCVVSEGDDLLLDMLGPAFEHFPQSDDGNYLGYHPADGAEAILNLSKLQSRGAQYILFPATSLWWLDYYTELKDYLDLNGERVFLDDELGMIVRLRSE